MKINATMSTHEYKEHASPKICRVCAIVLLVAVVVTGALSYREWSRDVGLHGDEILLAIDHVLSFSNLSNDRPFQTNAVLWLIDH